MSLKSFLQDRRKVMFTAGAIGGGLGLLVLARRGGSAPTQPSGEPLPEYVPAGTASIPNFEGADAALLDSTSASTIVGELGSLSSGVANLESAVGGLADIIVGNTGPAPTAPVPAAPTAVAPQPSTPAPATPTPAPTSLPRWTPPTNLAIGGATDIAGATFAGRAKLSNGQFAPIVKYANGRSQIHPTWQKWMEANHVTKAAS